MLAEGQGARTPILDGFAVPLDASAVVSLPECAGGGSRSSPVTALDVWLPRATIPPTSPFYPQLGAFLPPGTTVAADVTAQ